VVAVPDSPPDPDEGPPVEQHPPQHEPDEPPVENDQVYPRYDEYLREELSRVDDLVKAFLIRRQVRAQAADPVRGVTAAKFDWIDPIHDPDGRREFDRLVAKARQREEQIVRRLRHTDDRTRASFPLWDLTRAYDLIPGLSEVVPPHDREVPANAPSRRDTVLLDVLLLALLAERFPRYQPALAAADGPTGLTAGTVLEILRPETGPIHVRWDVFALDRPLVANGLIELDPADYRDRRPVRIDPRTADFLLGSPAPASQLPGVRYVNPSRTWEQLHLDQGPRELLQRLSARWWERPMRLVLLLHGPSGTPFLPVAEAFLTTTNGGKPRRWAFLLVDGPVALRVPDWDAFIRRLYQESLYRRAPVVWAGAEGLLAADQPPARWDALIRAAEAAPVPTFLSGETAWDPTRSFHAPGHYFVRVELPVPAPPTRRAIWKDRLARESNPLAADQTPAQQTALDLLVTFQFTEGQIDDALATARGLALAAHPAAPVPGPEPLYEACRRQSARRLVSFATRIQPRLDDDERCKDPKEVLAERVVLPPAAAAQLAELFDRMRALVRVYHDLGFEQRLHLGRGLVALFSGPTGTGKTLAATVLAALIGKDLYRVDMAAVVSKFVGETEKNLGRVFADAQDANAVLFFDEADALFGKRGSVEQGQDRWANLEVNYLLQRVEEYTGTVILATNIRENIDEAFLRRIQVLLDFPRPNVDARFNILRRMFTPRVVPPHDPTLHDFADRFDVTGGNIKNAVLDSAFRAVADGSVEKGRVKITDDHLVLGFAREFQKIGLPITPGVFGRKYYDKIVAALHLDLPRTTGTARRASG
jgi:hypothetical protein